MSRLLTRDIPCWQQACGAAGALARGPTYIVVAAFDGGDARSECRRLILASPHRIGFEGVCGVPDQLAYPYPIDAAFERESGSPR